MEQAFIDAELRLASYYLGLRDKIAALNIAVIGFSFTLYEKIEPLKFEFFGFLLVLGVLSFVAALRASISYNFHFNNYEDFVSKSLIEPTSCADIFLTNRLKYYNEKGMFALLTFGGSYIPTHMFWSIFIGILSPTAAIFVFHPW